MTVVSPEDRPVPAHRHIALRRLGVGLLLVVLLLCTAVTIALTFSVRVSGTSMEPTLRPGDRVMVNPFGDARRFDLVEAAVSAAGTTVVKRVIALPGDQVRIDAGQTPRVFVRPAGSRRWWRVDNPAWDRSGSSSTPCCAEDGTSTASPTTAVVPAGKYWTLGDHWDASTDSRAFGWVPRSDIRARLWVRLLPLGRMGAVPVRLRLVPDGQ